MDDKMLFGLTGTAVSAAGAGLSVTEIQAIVSIVVTVLGFIISVFVPLCIKLYQKIKKAREDGKIDEEEFNREYSNYKQEYNNVRSHLK